MLAARAAIESRRFPEARAALGELRELDAALPELAVLRAQLADAERAVRPRIGVLAAAAVSFVVVFAGASWLDLNPRGTVSSGDVIAAPPLPSRDLRELAFEVPVPTSGTGAPSLVDAEPLPPPVPAPAPVPDPAPAAVRSIPVVQLAALEVPPGAAVDRIELPPPAPARAPLPAVIAATPIAPAALDAAPARVVDDTAEVRAVLQRYQSAYDRLDAGLARAVWPAVNQEALARAFDGLESQAVTFSACDVLISGAAATAVCTGSTRYVPKIGSREPRVEPLVWNFTLRKQDTTWQIETARAER